MREFHNGIEKYKTGYYVVRITHGDRTAKTWHRDISAAHRMRERLCRSGSGSFNVESVQNFKK